LFAICFGFPLAGLLANLAPPAVAGIQPTVRWISTAADFHRVRRDMHAPESAIEKQWAANEFAFGRAIEAYEELIDSVLGRLR